MLRPGKSSANWDKLVTVGSRPLPATTGTRVHSHRYPSHRGGSCGPRRASQDRPGAHSKAGAGPASWPLHGALQPKGTRGRIRIVRPGTAPVPAWDPQTWVQSLLCLHHCVTWGKPCPSLGRVYTEGKGWALLALMRAPGLPSLWANVADVQVRCLPGERLGLQLGPVWASWGQPYASPLTAVGTGVGPRRHTHITQLRTLTAMLGLCKCTHMQSVHMDMHRHPGTPTNTHTVSVHGKDTPPSPLQLSASFTPRGQAWTTPLLPGPHLPQASLLPCPVASATPLPAGSPIQKLTGCGTSMLRGGTIAALPPRFPSLPIPALGLLPPPLLRLPPKPGASRPPIGPSSRQPEGSGGLGRI